MKKLVITLLIANLLSSTYAMENDYSLILTRYWNVADCDDATPSVTMDKYLFLRLVKNAGENKNLNVAAFEELQERIRTSRIASYEDKVVVTEKDLYVRLLAFVYTNGRELESNPPQYEVIITNIKDRLQIFENHETQKPQILKSHVRQQ